MSIMDKVAVLKNVLSVVDKIVTVMINCIDYLLKQKDIA